jgi:hypothetical protein
MLVLQGQKINSIWFGVNMSILDSVLNSTAVLTQPDFREDTLSDLQFQNLTEEIELIRLKITSGEEATVEEARKIVIWFRARRVKNFTLQKVKVVKEKAAPRLRATAAKRVKASDMDALELLKGL